MLLLWIGSAVMGGGFFAVLSGFLMLDTQFGSALLAGGLILASLGLAIWTLGLALRKRDRRPNGDATDILGTRVACEPHLAVRPYSLGEDGTPLARPR